MGWAAFGFFVMSWSTMLAVGIGLPTDRMSVDTAVMLTRASIVFSFVAGVLLVLWGAEDVAAFFRGWVR